MTLYVNLPDELKGDELKVSGTFSSRIGGYGVVAGAKEEADATEGNLGTPYSIPDRNQ